MSKPKVGVIHHIVAPPILHQGYFFQIPEFEVTAVAYQSMAGFNAGYLKKHPKIYYHDIDSCLFHTNGLGQAVSTNSFIESVQRIIEENDVIFLWGASDGIPDILKRCGKPVVVSSRGNCRWTQQMLEYCTPFGTHFTACSKLARHPFPPYIEHKNIRVIPNAVYMDRVQGADYPEVLKKSLGLEGKTVIGYIGRMPPKKNAIALLGCAHLLPEDYVLVFVGGDINPALKQQMINNPKVRYYPEKMNIGSILSIFDCFVSPSLAEGDGNSIKEAMASRIPVVSTFTGFIPETEFKYGQVCTHIPFDVRGSEMISAIKHALTRPFVDKAEMLMKTIFTPEVAEKQWTDLVIDCYEGNK